MDAQLLRIQHLRRIKLERDVFACLQKYGVKRSSVEQITEEFANRTPEEGRQYWYYSGPLDDKTRAFCKRMLTIAKVFSDEEIQKISDELNYDVLQFNGAYNCRHSWIRFRGKIISTPAPTVRDIRKLINDGITIDR